MDAFSEILSGVTLKVAVFFRAEFSARGVFPCPGRKWRQPRWAWEPRTLHFTIGSPTAEPSS